MPAQVFLFLDGQRHKQERLQLPQRIRNIITCKNPRCITSCEQELEQEFRLSDEKNRSYRCIYCDSEISRD